MPGVLHVIATPIGNLGDLSPRAVEVLKTVDLLLCEDTRHTGHLLATLGLKKETASLHAHNELGKIPQILERLQAGQQIGLVSDAGTPALSDPGQLLVDAVHAAGLQVRTVPGPFAVAAALAASGLTPIPCAFWGFLPKKTRELETLLERVLQPATHAQDQPMTHAFYVPGRDLRAVVQTLAGVRADARVVVARELTKIHEGYLRGVPTEILAQLTDEMLRGEAVLLVEVRQGSPQQTLDPHLLVQEAKAAGRERKEAMAEIMKRTGLSRNAVYALWLQE